MSAAPSTEEREELLLSCRYGDLVEVQLFVDTFGAGALEETRDENGNTILHMACGNGHGGMFLIVSLPFHCIYAFSWLGVLCGFCHAITFYLHE
jgi:hypothetical protein